MLSENELEILCCFFPTLQEKTAKEIEQATAFSHEPVFRALKILVGKGHLKLRKVGKSNVYRFLLTDDDLLVYTHFMQKRLHLFKKNHPIIFQRLKEFVVQTDARAIVLFGSYAKSSQVKASDIDLLVVSENNDAEKRAAAFRTAYNITLHPTVIRPADFKNIQTDNPAFHESLVAYGLVFSGLDFFFREIYGKKS